MKLKINVKSFLKKKTKLNIPKGLKTGGTRRVVTKPKKTTQLLENRSSFFVK